AMRADRNINLFQQQEATMANDRLKVVDLGTVRKDAEAVQAKIPLIGQAIAKLNELAGTHPLPTVAVAFGLGHIIPTAYIVLTGIVLVGAYMLAKNYGWLDDKPTNPTPPAA
ncbi:MAG: hypothetical protein WAX89_02935, partial [Alphaproteobacteria bacterium]